MKFSIRFCILAAVLIVGIHSQEQRVQICDPGSIFMDKCNNCRCSSDGFDKVCTRKRCPEWEANDGFQDDEERCVPGSTFKIDCNDCFCPSSGLKSAAGCTLKACIGDRFERAVVDPEDRCEPGSRFKIDCNDCVCPNSGMKNRAACTLKACF